MSWALLLTLVVALGLALLLAIARRLELARMRRSLNERDRVEEQSTAESQLQFPVIDLSRCLGCATCVAACPEGDVLEIVHGQAMVVNGARCVGVAACERECPVGAVTVTIANLEERRDVPATSANFEAVGSPGLFLAGEVTAHALIKTAIEHGAAVGSEVARRVRQNGRNGVLDLCIIGAGPAGLACSLEAKRNGLNYVTLDQEQGLGGTVAKYPRRKLVMTQPVEMPLHGRLKRTTYTKEELMELWQGIAAEHQLSIRQGEVFVGLDRDDSGNYTVRTETGSFVAKHVCLAVGRRGVPRQLGVPGEDLPKVAYSLLDAQSYSGRRVLVVGGGDSAVEAAMALAEQPGNEVTLSYRKQELTRVRAKNRERLERCLDKGGIDVIHGSQVSAIRPDSVELAIGNDTRTLPNDDVFVMAGGIPPFELLENSGVSFDPKLRAAPAPIIEQGTGITKALVFAFLLTLAALVFAILNSDYYLLPPSERPVHPGHHELRPGRGIGLWLGIAATGLVGLNLLYLLRRSPRFRLNTGSLQLWMTIHVATGILALLAATLHGAMDPRDTVGGHAFWALAVLMVTGAIGRYFYAYVPRAANGRELELAEVKAQMGGLSEEWDQGHHRFREQVRSEIFELIEQRQWKGSFVGRLLALLGVRRSLRRVLHRLADEGREQGVPEAQIQATLVLARRAHQTALMAAHYEDLRALLSSWRWFHKWIALLMVLLICVHIYSALTYGTLLGGGR